MMPTNPDDLYDLVLKTLHDNATKPPATYQSVARAIVTAIGMDSAADPTDEQAARCAYGCGQNDNAPGAMHAIYCPRYCGPKPAPIDGACGVHDDCSGTGPDRGPIDSARSVHLAPGELFTDWPETTSL